MKTFKIIVSEPPGWQEMPYMQIFDFYGDTWAVHMCPVPHHAEYCVRHFATGKFVYAQKFIDADTSISEAKDFIQNTISAINTVVSRYPTINDRSRHDLVS